MRHHLLLSIFADCKLARERYEVVVRITTKKKPDKVINEYKVAFLKVMFILHAGVFAVILQQLNCSLGYVYVSSLLVSFSLNILFAPAQQRVTFVWWQQDVVLVQAPKISSAFAPKLSWTSCFAEHIHALKQSACSQPVYVSSICHHFTVFLFASH